MRGSAPATCVWDVRVGREGAQAPWSPHSASTGRTCAWAGRAACHQMLALWQSLLVRGLLRAGDPIRDHPAPRGHWTMSGDLCGCHQWGASGIKGVGASSAVQYPPLPRTVPTPPHEGPPFMSAEPEGRNLALGEAERQWICSVSESWCWR